MHRKWHLLVFLLFISVYLSSSQSTCQSNRAYLSYFQCTIGYKTCTNQQSQVVSFSLEYCLQKFCTSSDCTQFYEVQQTPSNCPKRCCNSSSTVPLKLDSLNQCIANNNQLSSGSSGLSYQNIVIITIASAVIFMCFLCIVFRIRNRCCPNCFQRNQNNQVYVEPQQAVQVVKWYGKVNSMQSQYPLTSQNGLNKPSEEQGVCCICLDGQTNCVTVCEHKFHVLCLAEWIKKKKQCPLCTRSNLNPVKITCQNCFQKWCLYSLTAHPLPPQLARKTIFCENCSKLSVPLKNQNQQKKKKKTSEQQI